MKSDNDNDKNNSKSTMINFLFKDQVSSSSSSKNQHRKNHISYYCNICKRESRFIGVKKKDIKNIGNIGNNITSNNNNIDRSSSST
nr:13049_t:CDS:2 [Entrophospora candida]